MDRKIISQALIALSSNSPSPKYSQEKSEYSENQEDSRQIEKTGAGMGLCVYTGELTQKCLKEQTAILQNAFPGIDKSWIMILTSMISKDQWCDQRLRDAVSNLVCNCTYPRPALADLLSFNKVVKLYSYTDVCHLCHEYYNAFDHYKRIVINGSPSKLYAKIDDILKYSLNIVEKNK